MVIRQAEIRDSVANVSQIVTIDRSQILDLAGRVSKTQLEDVLAGLDVVWGR